MNPSPDMTEKEAADKTVATDSAQKAQDQRQPESTKFLGIRLPEAVGGPTREFMRHWRNARQASIKTLPDVVINNSSNAIGATQMVGEFLMFKAGGGDLIEAEQKGNPITYLYKAPANIVKTVFGKSKPNGKLSDILNPSYLMEEIKHFNNLERATLIDSANGTKKLVNRFSSRSGFSGMTAMFLSTIFPDEKDTPEVTLKNVTLAKQNPVLYATQRVGQALWFPVEAPIRLAQKIVDPGHNQHIGEHKRQFAGLGMFMAGTFSVISGFRQIEGKWGKETQHYMRNPWQMLGGGITMIAGSWLGLGIDNQQGWSNYGNVQFGRLIPLVPSITTRFKPGPNGKPEQGAVWYLGAQSALQFKNFVASMIGGAEKHTNPDGTVTLIDHKAIRKEANEIARENIKDSKHDKLEAKSKRSAADAEDTAPSTKVTAMTALEAAMPERAEAAKQAAINS